MTTVGTIPVYLVPGRNPACTVHNLGPSAVYLGGSSITPGQGRLLDVGSKLVWNAGDLWAVADTTANVNIYDGSGTEFDPKAIADQISIAPTRARLSDTLLTVDANNDVSTNRVQCNAYSSLLLQFTSNALTESNQRLGLRRVSIDWYPDATTTKPSHIQRFTLQCKGSYEEINLTVRDNYMRIRVWATAFPGTVQCTISGYSVPLDLPTYAENITFLDNETQYWSVVHGDGLEGVIYLRPSTTGTTNSSYPLSIGGRSGECQVTVEKAGASDSAFQLTILSRYIDDGTVLSAPISVIEFSRSGNNSADTFIAPPGGLQLLYTRTSTSIRPQVVLAWK